jgi:transcriptional regulator with XRE-family HTH domain
MRISSIAQQITGRKDGRMSDLLEAIRTAKGSETQVRFARRLGVSQTELSRVLKGERSVGPKIARAIVREFPELRDSVASALLQADAVA